MPRPQRKRTIYQLPGCRFFRAEPEEDPGTVGPEKAGERGKESGTGRLAGPSEEKMAEEKEAGAIKNASRMGSGYASRCVEQPDAADSKGRMDQDEPVVELTLDELETIRLMDQEGLDQSECAKRLHVARTTAQNIIRQAHKKVADALVDGKSIRICGGNVEYSDDSAFGCCRWIVKSVPRRGGLTDFREVDKMKIAVTYDNSTGQVFQHFGRTEFFKVFDIEDGKIKDSQVYSTNGQGHGALAGVLRALDADVLICCGIGGGAQMALSEAGIKLYGGCSGAADIVVQNFLAGKLDYQEDVKCDHHGEHHGGNCGHEAGTCGHGCH